MHLLPSIVLLGKIASVVQASIHLVQVPQWFVVVGWSYSNSKSIINSAKNK